MDMGVREVSLYDVLSGNLERIFFIHTAPNKDDLDSEYKQLIVSFHKRILFIQTVFYCKST